MTYKTPDPTPGCQYGRLTVIGPIELRGKYKYVPVRCGCGTEKVLEKSNLLSGRTKSCGCYGKEISAVINYSHGKRGEPVYAVWNMMKQRCYSPNNRMYPRYGGRGITVCEPWHTFEGFYSDMGDPPFKGASLDRIDNDKDYCKDNCRWATKETQANNTSNSVRYNVFGEQMTIKQAAAKYNIKVATLTNRIYTYGMSAEEAVTRPVMTNSESGALAGTGGQAVVRCRVDGHKLYDTQPKGTK